MPTTPVIAQGSDGTSSSARTKVYGYRLKLGRDNSGRRRVDAQVYIGVSGRARLFAAGNERIQGLLFDVGQEAALPGHVGVNRVGTIPGTATKPRTADGP